MAEFDESVSSTLSFVQTPSEQYIANKSLLSTLGFVQFGEVGDALVRTDTKSQFQLQQILQSYLNVPNIYGTVEGGDDYFSNRLKSKAWRFATPQDKRLALGEATSLIDRLNFLGFKNLPTQFLQFPRGTDTIVPNDIIFATYELALRLLEGIDPERESENLQVISRQYATTNVSYNRSGVPEHVLAGIPSVRAWSLLKPYLRDPATVILSRVS